MEKAGEKEKTEDVKRARQIGFLSALNYIKGLDVISEQVKNFRNLEKYAGGRNDSGMTLKAIAQNEYQSNCRLYEDCRVMVSEFISAPSLRRTLRGRLDQLKSDLDSSYKTLNDYIDGRVKHA